MKRTSPRSLPLCPSDLSNAHARARYIQSCRNGISLSLLNKGRSATLQVSRHRLFAAAKFPRLELRSSICSILLWSLSQNILNIHTVSPLARAAGSAVVAPLAHHHSHRAILGRVDSGLNTVAKGCKAVIWHRHRHWRALRYRLYD